MSESEASGYIVPGLFLVHFFHSLDSLECEVALKLQKITIVWLKGLKLIVSDIFSCKTGRAKIDNPMKGQHIGVMLTNGKAPAFGKCRAAHGNDIIPIELPVGVLESVEKTIVARDHFFHDCPVP